MQACLILGVKNRQAFRGGSVMKRLEKYRITSIRGSAPERLQLHLESRLVAEIRVADGIARLVLPVLDDPDVHACMWFASVLGEDELADVERDHVLHVAIERLDGFVDPQSEHGKLDPREPIPPILLPEQADHEAIPEA